MAATKGKKRFENIFNVVKYLFDTQRISYQDYLSVAEQTKDTLAYEHFLVYQNIVTDGIDYTSFMSSNEMFLWLRFISYDSCIFDKFRVCDDYKMYEEPQIVVPLGVVTVGKDTLIILWQETNFPLKQYAENALDFMYEEFNCKYVKEYNKSINQ